MAQFYYGGQAVIEGVMMRGRRHMAIAVRAPDGQILCHDEALPTAFTRYANWPLVRGVLLLGESLALGVRSLRFSAAVASDESPSSPEAPPRSTDTAQYMAGASAGVNAALATSLLIAVAVFFVAPLLLVGWTDSFMPDWASNLLEGAIRLAFLLGYLALVGRIPEIQRVFGYHGAEHKTINTYDAGRPLTPREVQQATVIHPRCGTTFLLIVVVLAILVFILLGRPPIFWRLVSRIVLVPVVAAFAYEAIRWAAGHYGNRVVRTLMAPGLALQRLTTRPPDDSMVEVGIAALQRVLILDGVVDPQARSEYNSNQYRPGTSPAGGEVPSAWHSSAT